VGTKEPIAVDVKMRIDVYHHVKEQASYIEDIVSGEKSIPDVTEDGNNSSKLWFFESKTVYAQQESAKELTPRMLKAIRSRRGRHDKIVMWESKGAIMEGKYGYVEVNTTELKNYSPDVQSDIKTIVNGENYDRKIIYSEVAQKNNLSVSEVGRQFSYTQKEKAPGGTWIEVKDSNSNWTWKRK